MLTAKAAKNIKSCNFHFLSEVFFPVLHRGNKGNISGQAVKKKKKKRKYSLKQLIVNAGMCHVTDSARGNWNEF